MIPGIDVSHYQADIDWQQVKQSGIQFAFIKATDGVMGADSMFGRNWSGAKSVGLPFGCYHFLEPGNIEQQIRNLRVEISYGPSDAIAVLDAELSTLALSDVETFLAAFPGSILYTDPAMIKQWAAPDDAPAGEAFAELFKHPLWIAEYNVPAPRFSPWDNWTFWQYGTGRVSGISTLVDLDWFNGTIADLQQFMNSSKLPT